MKAHEGGLRAQHKDLSRRDLAHKNILVGSKVLILGQQTRRHPVDETRDIAAFHQEAVLALARAGADAAACETPEKALWAITRTLPALLGHPAAALRPHAYLEDPPPKLGAASAAFMRTPDGRHHLVVASVNFAPEQHHEKVAIELGHPGVVARSQRPLLLKDTALHEDFVKILQRFRAGSVLFAPMLWQGNYLGVLICANAARFSYSEQDLAVHRVFAELAAAVWIAQDGPRWLVTIDYTRLPERTTA